MKREIVTLYKCSLAHISLQELTMKNTLPLLILVHVNPNIKQYFNQNVAYVNIIVNALWSNKSIFIN